MKKKSNVSHHAKMNQDKEKKPLAQTKKPQLDGFRYDYDDSDDL